MTTLPDAAAAPLVACRPTAWLEVRDESGPRFCLPLSEGRFVIGRSAEAHIHLNHITVSRQHAELFCDPFDRWWIADLGSRNGVQINGESVTESLLEPGDALRIGKFELLFGVIAAAPAGGAAPAEAAPPLDSDEGHISTLEELRPPKIDASHLGPLLDFGHRLAQIDGIEDRLRALCRLMVTGTFPGVTAVALRLSKAQAGDAAEPLCPPQWRQGAGEGVPYLSRALLRSLRRTGGPVMAGNVLADVGANDLTAMGETPALSAVACPLRDGERTLDVLYVTLPPACGTAEWLAIVALAAKEYQHAVAAWASRRQSEAHAALERELQRARQIQLRLVPQGVTIGGLDLALDFRPCHWVAGDYLDVMRAPDGRVLLAVADVSGKGLEAALTTSSLHTMVHISVRAGVGLAEMMAGLNQHLRDYLPEDAFATMLCLLLDPLSGAVEYANAGHPPALVIDAQGELRELRCGANLPLGVGDEPIEVQADRIEPGELLAMFSDGLTEMADESGKLLGLSALGQHLRWATASAGGDAPVRTVSERLASLLETHRGARTPQDDCTLLLARRRLLGPLRA